MFNWIPRMHWLAWFAVICIGIAIYRDPASMGARGGSLIHGVEHFFGQVVVFFESIH